MLLTVRDAAWSARRARARRRSSRTWTPTARSVANWRSSASARTTAPTLTGNTLEDEKILGTAHVAFGASAGIGGSVTVPVHEDVVVLAPSLRVGSTQVLDGGRYVLG